MSKTTLGVLVIAGIAAVAFYVFNRPEPAPPTAQERLEAAAEKAQEATQEAVAAVSDAAREVGEDLADSATQTAEEMKAKVSEALADVAEQVAQASEDTQAQMRQFMEDWKTSGILTDDGIDFAKAKASIEASDLAADAKSGLNAVLKALEDAPGAIEEKLDALKTLLNT